MPAIAHGNSIVFVAYQMPRGSGMASQHIDNQVELHREVAKVWREAQAAYERFRRGTFSGVGLEASLLDPVGAQDALKSYALSQGHNFEEVVRGASLHFSSPNIQRRTHPLTHEELESLLEDDQRAFGR